MEAQGTKRKIYQKEWIKPKRARSMLEGEAQRKRRLEWSSSSSCEHAKWGVRLKPLGTETTATKTSKSSEANTQRNESVLKSNSTRKINLKLFKLQLANWALVCKVPDDAIDHLLQLLRTYVQVHIGLMKTAESLRKEFLAVHGPVCQNQEDCMYSVKNIGWRFCASKKDMPMLQKCSSSAVTDTGERSVASNDTNGTVSWQQQIVQILTSLQNDMKEMKSTLSQVEIQHGVNRAELSQNDLNPSKESRNNFNRVAESRNHVKLVNESQNHFNPVKESQSRLERAAEPRNCLDPPKKSQNNLNRVMESRNHNPVKESQNCNPVKESQSRLNPVKESQIRLNRVTESRNYLNPSKESQSTPNRVTESRNDAGRVKESSSHPKPLKESQNNPNRAKESQSHLNPVKQSQSDLNKAKSPPGQMKREDKDDHEEEVVIVEDLIPTPMKTKAELEDFDGRLTTDKKLRRNMLATLAHSRDRNIGKSMRRIMGKVATNEVWRRYCLMGKSKGKDALYGMKILNIFYRVCKSIHPNCTEGSFKAAVSGILIRAPQNAINQSKAKTDAKLLPPSSSSVEDVKVESLLNDQ